MGYSFNGVYYEQIYEYNLEGKTWVPKIHYIPFKQRISGVDLTIQKMFYLSKWAIFKDGQLYLKADTNYNTKLIDAHHISHYMEV